MSEPKRYSFCGMIVHLPGGGVRPEVHFKIDEDGLFVAYQDYEKLKAEVERLRKAGDAMDTFLGPCHASRQWRAAKEGRPNE